MRSTTLIKLGIELASERNPQRLLASSCCVVQDIWVAKYAVVGIVSEDHSRLEHFVMRGLDETALVQMPWPAPGDGILGDILEKQIPRTIDALDGNPAALGLPPDHPPVHSILVAPITSQDTSFGLPYLVDMLGSDEFSEVDERAAATVAAQLAVVYENLQLYGAIEKQHSQLKLEVSDRKHA